MAGVPSARDSLSRVLEAILVLVRGSHIFRAHARFDLPDHSTRCQLARGRLVTQIFGMVLTTVRLYLGTGPVTSD